MRSLVGRALTGSSTVVLWIVITVAVSAVLLVAAALLPLFALGLALAIFGRLLLKQDVLGALRRVGKRG